MKVTLGLFAMMAVVACLPSSSSGAPQDPPPKGEVSVSGGGGNKQGAINVQGSRTLFQDDKTKLGATLMGGAAWQPNTPNLYSGSARLDAERKLYESQNARVTGNAWLQRDVGTGRRPSDSYGAGIEATRIFHKGRDGSTFEGYVGAQRQFDNNRNQFNTGLRYRF